MATDRPSRQTVGRVGCGVVGLEVGVHVGGLCVGWKQAVPTMISPYCSNQSQNQRCCILNVGVDVESARLLLYDDLTTYHYLLTPAPAPLNRQSLQP